MPSRPDINSLPANFVYGNKLQVKNKKGFKNKKHEQTSKTKSNNKKQDAIISSILNHKKKVKGKNATNTSKNKDNQINLKLSEDYVLINPITMKGIDQSESKNQYNQHKKKQISKSVNENVEMKNYSDKSLKNSLSINEDKDSHSVSKMNSHNQSHQNKSLQKKSLKIRNKTKSKNLLENIQTHNDGEQVSKKDSVENGLQCFKSILQNYDIDEFFSEYWEKKPLLIKGNVEDNPYINIFSTSTLDSILRKQKLYFTKNIDVTSYIDGKRETLNQEGRALAPVVWNFYNNGCSVRLLNPQTFHEPVWKLLESLQEYFGSFCGANVYLTPPRTQGFAPHWDDIEAFILQLEGKKHWRVYQPKIANTLPRISSGNFTDGDDLGEKIIDCELCAGDMLYFPRGFIHQGRSTDEHSLHITISSYQKTSWVDFLEKLLPVALASASDNNPEFRKGLPIGYLRHLAENDTTKAFKEIRNKTNSLLSEIITSSSLKNAGNIMAKSLIYDALPPALTKKESMCTVFGDGETWSDKDKNTTNTVEFTAETSVRLVRKGCVRILEEDETMRLYSSVQNSREYHEIDPINIEINDEEREVVEYLMENYPKYVQIEDLPMEESDSIELVTALWENGILRTKVPLCQKFSE